MPLPTNKKELLTNLQKAYSKLDEEFDIIPQDLMREKTVEGEVSPCDVLAYQIGWGKVLLNWEKTEQAGKTPSMPKKGFKWNQLGELANSFYKQYEKKSPTQLRKLFQKTVGEIELLINELPEKEIFKPHMREWTGEKWAMVKWIQINTIAPYSSARTKIRRWKKENLD